jgi:hypothetical protein
MSKGDKQRPGTGYSDGWDRVFGRAPIPDAPQEIVTNYSGQKCICLPGRCLARSLCFDIEKRDVEAPKFELTLTDGRCLTRHELVKSSAIHCANDMAAKGDSLLLAINEQHAAEMNESTFAESDTSNEAMRACERLDDANADLGESIRGMRSAIYEYRKRMGK